MHMEGCMVHRIANILSIIVLLTLIATPVMGAGLPPAPGPDRVSYQDEGSIDVTTQDATISPRLQ